VSEEGQPLPPFLRRIREGSSREAAVQEAETAGSAPGPGVQEGALATSDSPRDGLLRALAEVGEQVDEIIADAERAAEQIREEGQADADRYLEERRRQAEAHEAETRRRIETALSALRSGLAGITAEADRVFSSVEAAIDDADAGNSVAGDSGRAASDTGPPPSPPAGTFAYPGRGSASEQAGMSDEILGAR
jgi:cell division septum initiation protein DivIVA